MKEVRGKKEPSLIKAIARTFWREYALLGFIQFFNGTYWFNGQIREDAMPNALKSDQIL